MRLISVATLVLLHVSTERRHLGR